MLLKNFTLESWCKFIHHLDEFVESNEYRRDVEEEEDILKLLRITLHEVKGLLKIENAVHIRLGKLFSRRVQVGLELTELIRRLLVQGVLHT